MFCIFPLLVAALIPLGSQVVARPLSPERELYILDQKRQGIIGYGPGLGVYGPYSYVDLSYNNIPFVGKIPLVGKEGTSSRLGISPFYPPTGNPSNPIPPLYKARPLPLHVPDPVEVVAVPLDEETLHGEPLFPKELILPGALKADEDSDEKGSLEN
ncbi:hypothetical protein L596_002765 [Steinernema carpocapsae]|uniref:Uncharacterized protein n=1 Tax=Steinernema carpocapsae TaxID=34508 RepID=A0A4U8UQN2_STECR|nr:hypothetical protein L596_002765 [Steinernema carpocapsae]